ncbi:hypothetical protein BDB00DRAFT_801814 [Zychaea mexicana]|uniref:uncharacterized protein n=1 Tax=Zychaea mexicana TaxID=64656 RepID=UPI0022FEE03E|nr:uncharacterized protein BDB00DRAFT_801814 [Zychaea mexicana]KAI9498265.1 hypothetical protein BDB00DRAFT_801814 [Zychaea mexicana]
MTTSKSDDTPKSFARLFRYKDITEKKQKEKQDAKKREKEKEEELKIRKGERLREFNERVNKKYQQDFIQAVKATKPLSQRKRRNRESRKQKQQEKKQRQMDQYGGRDFDDLKDSVKFGEVADAPPTFTKIPKARGRGRETLEAKTREAVSSDEDEGMKQLKASHKRKLQNMSASARKTLDGERERAIEMYRAKKAKKMVASGLTPLTS